MRSKHSVKERKRILSEWILGDKSSRTLCAENGIKRHTLWSWSRMYGISKKDGRRNNTSQFKPFGIRRIQVLELAYMKEDMEDIAKVLGLPIRRVERYIRAYRLGIRLKYT